MRPRLASPLFVVIFSLSLSACLPPGPAPIGTASVAVQNYSAQIQATQAAQTLGTARAAAVEATAQAQATAQAADRAATGTAHTLNLQATQSAATATQFVMFVESTHAADNATAQAQAATATRVSGQAAQAASDRAATATEAQGLADRADARVRAKQTDDLIRTGLWAAVVVIFIGALAFVIVGAKAASAWLEDRREQRQRQNNVLVLRQAVLESRAGTLFFDPTTARPIVLLPPHVNSAGTPDELERLLGPSDAPEADTLTINQNGHSWDVPRLTDEEMERRERARGLMMLFLRKACEVGDPASNRVPSATTIPWGKNDKPSSSQWTRAVRLFGDALVSPSPEGKSGTWVAEGYGTLTDLARAVRAGRVNPRL